MAHGSKYHRGVGSLGTMLPKRVLKGKALPSHMGDEKTTIQNLEIIKIDMEEGWILIKGSVPGANNSLVVVTSAVKTDKKKEPFDVITYDYNEKTVEDNASTEVSETVDTSVNTEETAEANM